MGTGGRLRANARKRFTFLPERGKQVPRLGGFTLLLWGLCTPVQETA